MRWTRTNVLLLAMVLACALVGNATSYANELTDSIIFTEETIYPEDVENALTDDELLEQQSAKIIQANKKAYVILSLGWKPSTGYTIDVTNAKIKNDQLIVWATVHHPSNDFVGYVFTVPMKIISVPDSNQQLKHLTVIYS